MPRNVARSGKRDRRVRTAPVTARTRMPPAIRIFSSIVPQLRGLKENAIRTETHEPG
jgi:hypothetical protein